MNGFYVQSWLTQLERDQNITRFIDAKTKSIYFISINTPPFEMYAVVPSSPKRLKTDKIVCQERHLILPLRTLLVNLQEELRMLVKAQKLIENDEIVRLELLCQKWKEASVAIFETIQTNWHEEIGLEDLMIAGGFNPEALEFESELKESSLYNLALSDGLGSSNRHNSGPMSSEDN